MTGFDEMLARLKTYFGFCTDAELAKILGITYGAWIDFRQRDVFPDHLVVALMNARPALGIDYQFVMTGCHTNMPPAGTDF